MNKILLIENEETGKYYKTLLEKSIQTVDKAPLASLKPEALFSF